MASAVRWNHEDARVDRVAALLSKPRLLEQYAALEKRIQMLRQTIDPIDHKIEAADARALRAVKVSALSCFTFLTIQFGVLFNWVFFVFDWNLVEPVTYFLGYTCTWFGIMFYARTGIEWSYDSTRDFIRTKRRDKMLKAERIDLDLHKARIVELAQLEAELKALNVRD
jgi:hypothetical protein